MSDIPKEPESDWNKWQPKYINAKEFYYHTHMNLVQLRDTLRELQISHTNKVLDRIDVDVLKSECNEAKDVIDYIMRK